MKSLILLIFGIATSTCGLCQNQDISNDFIKEEISRGRSYIVAFLKNGPNSESLDSTLVKNNQESHLLYLFGLKRQGKLAVFGPFIGNDALRGLCIFASQDVTEVKQLLDEDPHMKSGYLSYEIHRWWPPWRQDSRLDFSYLLDYQYFFW